MGYTLPEYYKGLAKLRNIECPNLFIETGTFKGGIPHRVLESGLGLDDFNQWYTVELGESIARIASKRYKYFEEYFPDIPPHYLRHTDEEDLDFNISESYFNNKLHLFCSDSVSFLKEFLPTINVPCCFWLDAHAGALKYARGSKDVPLLDELSVIMEYDYDHIIAIDDAHLFGKDQNGLCDYTDITIEKIKDIVTGNGYQVFESYPYQMKMLTIFK